jgi:hypothetical protein
VELKVTSQPKLGKKVVPLPMDGHIEVAVQGPTSSFCSRYRYVCPIGIIFIIFVLAVIVLTAYFNVLRHNIPKNNLKVPLLTATPNAEAPVSKQSRLDGLVPPKPLKIKSYIVPDYTCD